MSSLNIHFLDVGQGDGIYVKFPNGSSMIVDMGSRKSKSVTQSTIPAFFKAGANPIFKDAKKSGEYNFVNLLVLTHADEDHYNMIVEFLTSFKVLINDLFYGGHKADYTLNNKNHIDLIIEQQASLRKEITGKVAALNVRSNIHTNGTYPCKMGDLRKTGEAKCELWMLACNAGSVASGSTSDSTATAKNTRSIVLQIKFGTVNVMLTGDATVHTESAVYHNCKTAVAATGWDANLKSSLWKVQHHGSARTSVSSAWLKLVIPEYAFIMSDMHASNKLPQDFCIDRILKEKSIKTYTSTNANHDYVSYYDPKDFPATTGGATGATDSKAEAKWVQRSTTRAVHTSIAQMKGGKAEDTVGVRIDVYVGADGGIMVHDTGLTASSPLREFT